jgi:hypothetical protein
MSEAGRPLAMSHRCGEGDGDDLLIRVTVTVGRGVAFAVFVDVDGLGVGAALGPRQDLAAAAGAVTSNARDRLIATASPAVALPLMPALSRHLVACRQTLEEDPG